MFVIHLKQFKNKPNNFETAWIQNTWNNAFLTNDIKALKQALEQGQTIKFNTAILNTIIIDADKPNQPLEHYLNILKEHNLMPTLAYKSFSANDIDKHNFRLIYFVNNLNKDAYYNFTNQLKQLLNIELDNAFVKNHKQICYGTNKQVYMFNQSPIKLDYTPTPIKQQINPIQAINTTTNSKDIIYLNSLPYRAFIKELKSIINNQQHIGYDIALRWVFANFAQPELQQQILSLASKDTQQKVNQLLRTKPQNYLLRLVEKDSNFYKLYLANHKLKNKNKTSNLDDIEPKFSI